MSRYPTRAEAIGRIHFSDIGFCLIAVSIFSGARYNFIIRKRARWKRFLRSHVNAMPSISYGPGLCVKQIYRRACRISHGSSMHAEDIAKQAKGIRESGARTLPTPNLSSVRFNPRGLHYDGMHNARWVRRRAVCASYIAMADGRDSEKDFPNGISSPRTAYIFHGRGRANRLPLLSSIFCAPRDISHPPPSPIDVDEWNISRSLSRGL